MVTWAPKLEGAGDIRSDLKVWTLSRFADAIDRIQFGGWDCYKLLELQNGNFRIPSIKYTGNHKKGNSCSIRYFSWKKWVFGIFFLRYGKSIIKWSQCHKSHEIISISKDFIVKRRYGIRICVWTVNFSKDIKKGIFFIWFLSFAVQEINWYHRPFERYLKELSFAANLTFLAQFV